MARDATVFPQAIGVAARSVPSSTEAIADAVRRQMRAIGAHQGLSPGARRVPRPALGPTRGDLRRGPVPRRRRWGWPSSAGCRATTLDRPGVVATAKHFVGYGASEGGINWAPAHLPERELRDVYLRPFEAAVRDAGLRVGDERLPRARRRAVRRPTLAADRRAPRRVGLRRHRRVRLLRRQAARRVPPGRGRRRRGGGAGARRRHRRRAARAPTATASRCRSRGRQRVRRRWPTSTSPSAGCCASKFRLGLFERPYVDLGRCARPRHGTPEQIALAAADRRREPGAARATTASLPLRRTCDRSR